MKFYEHQMGMRLNQKGILGTWKSGYLNSDAIRATFGFSSTAIMKTLCEAMMKLCEIM
jgi:hypothetical protein